MQPAKEVTETAVLDLATLLDARDDAAVTLVAGETRLLAHRDVLVARSPVFAAMMRHDTLEARSGQVTITDVEGSVLRVLLAFLYTLQLPQLPDLAAGLLAAADKYDLPALKTHCEQQLVGLLDVESAVAAGVLALRHGCASLSQAAVSFTKEHVYQVMATKGWSDAVANDPQTFLEFSRLIAEPAAGSR